uniref:Uncharacterized protein n=1 Tax=Ananas comosus var. bracteatus TaxID=296719 RepID=A0A6V7QGB7_ANACO|nr:unnamed protein product [Ananas comosus var. bracteatus]
MMIFGASEVSRNVDLGDETTTMMCKFVVRASDASITREIGSDIQSWLDDITDGGVEYMPEDEVKIAAAERLRVSMEKIALLKAAKPKPQPQKTEEEKKRRKKKEEEVDENGNPKGLRRCLHSQRRKQSTVHCRQRVARVAYVVQGESHQSLTKFGFSISFL